jgi:MoaA/NifB/PqqE/SkfB family radical SAM enzyme
MNFERWTNVQRARASYERGAPGNDGYPLEAFFEVAARCNLRCQMCAINYDSRYRPRSERPPMLLPDLFDRLRPIFPTLLRAYLFGLGEPMLNPHLIEYARTLSGAGAEVWFNTNATLIDERKAAALAEAGVGRITVSIDGATAETYERIRVGATFDAVLRGIRALLAARRQYGRPAVDFSFVAMASNIAELPQLVDLCAELGAQGVHVEPLYAQEQPDLESHYQRENLGVAGGVERLFGEAVRRAEVHGVRLASRFLEEGRSFDYVERAPTLGIHWRCSEPWSSIWVTSAGEVRTCCINDTSFGNLFEQTFDEIWNGDAYVAFRRQHAAREEAAGCGNCVRNGRVRTSPFFSPVRAVTYRPLPRLKADDSSAVSITWPALGDTVTDPLVVKGVIRDGGGDFEVMIDDTAVGQVASAESRGGFVFHGNAPWLTEGAHLLWIRRSGDGSGRGWAHREIFLWRPDQAGPAVRMTTAGAIHHFAPTTVRMFSMHIGGHRWREYTAHKPLEYGRTSRLVFLDLSRLPTGEHDVTVRVNGRRSGSLRIARLPT